MIDLLTTLCLILGGASSLVAALGVWRLPDATSKMHAATKSGAFATAWFLLAAVLHLGTTRAVVLGLLFLVFYYLTAPLGAMYLARELWPDRSKEKTRAE